MECSITLHTHPIPSPSALTLTLSFLTLTLSLFTLTHSALTLTLSPHPHTLSPHPHTLSPHPHTHTRTSHHLGIGLEKMNVLSYLLPQVRECADTAREAHSSEVRGAGDSVTKCGSVSRSEVDDS